MTCNSLQPIKIKQILSTTQVWVEPDSIASLEYYNSIKKSWPIRTQDLPVYDNLRQRPVN